MESGIYSLKIPKNIYDQVKYLSYSKVNVKEFYDYFLSDAKNTKKLMDWGLGDDEDLFKVPRKPRKSN